MPDQQDLERKLLSWLDTQGYPLEMRVARAFQKAGFRVIQSDYYTDPETGESREIDVLASQKERDGDLVLGVTVVAECKSSKDKPWILFSTEECTLPDQALVSQRAASTLGHRVLSRLSDQKDIQLLPLFRVPATPAYGLTQAFTSGHDICYGAATAVADAAAAMVESANRNAQRQIDIVEIIFPVIITEARLFSACLHGDSSIAISEIQSGVLLWRNPLVGLPHTIIHVVSLSALEQFVADALVSAQRLLGLLLGSHRELVAKTRDWERLFRSK